MDADSKTDYLRAVIREIFTVSLLTYLVFYLIEGLIDGFISDHLNLNILLGVVIVSGVFLTLLLRESAIQEDHDQTPITLGTAIIMVALGLLSVGIIWIKTVSLGWLSLPLAILGGVTATLLSFVALSEHKTD